MDYWTAAKDSERTRAGRLIRHPLRLARRKLITRTQRVTVRTFWGDPMTVVLPEEVSLRIYEFRIWEPTLTRLFLDRARPGSVVFDIGAHFGYFSLLGSHLGAEVHAFEPTPTTCDVLQKNVGLRAKVNKVALWSRSTTLTIADYGLVGSAFNSVGVTNHLSDEAATRSLFRVPATTIDDYVTESGAIPDIIKLDVEKAEEQILTGGERTIAAHKPLVTVEVAEGAESKRLLVRMIERGYRPFNLTTEGVTPHTLRDSYTYDNILLAPESLPLSV